MATRQPRPRALFVGYAQTPGGGDEWENAPIGTYEYRFPVPPLHQEVILKQHVLRQLEDGDDGQGSLSTEVWWGDHHLGDIHDGPDDTFMYKLGHALLYVRSEVGGPDNGPAYQYFQVVWVNARFPNRETPDEIIDHLYEHVHDRLVMHQLPGHHHMYGIPEAFHVHNF